MRTISYRTCDVNQEWFVVDAQGQALGRLASRIAMVLRGKHKAVYTPHNDTGDFVVVVNCDKVALTRAKMDGKVYRIHSGYIGNMKTFSARKMMARKPEYLLREAVKGMLPHNPLGRKMFGKLKVYSGAEHPHAAQQPKTLDLSVRAR